MGDWFTLLLHLLHLEGDVVAGGLILQGEDRATSENEVAELCGGDGFTGGGIFHRILRLIGKANIENSI